MNEKTGKKQALKFSNSTTWKKGFCPNKNGRPKKGYSIAERMREMFAANPEKKDQIIIAMYESAVNEKNVQAAKLIISYLDGLPNQVEKPIPFGFLMNSNYNDISDFN